MFLMMVDNLALILVMLVVYQYLHGRIDTRLASKQVFSALSGLLFGIVGILSMFDSHALMPGIFFDGRTIVLGIAGAFGGPLVASIAASMCAGTRLLLGGQGALLGIVAIVEAATLGTVFHELVKVKRLTFNAPAILALAVAIHGIQLAINLFLPNRLGFEIIPIIAPTILLLFPLTFLVISWIFLFLQKSQDEHASLNASELRYRTMFENNTAMMLLIDPDNGRIVDANPAAASFYGYSRQTLRQMKITQINTLNQEEAQEVIQRMLAANHGYFTLRHRDAAGEMRDVEIYSASIRFDGRILLHEIIHDVTDREYALRERLLLYEAIDSSFNEVYIFDDTTLHFTYVSHGALLNLGYTMEQMRALTPLDLKRTMPEAEFARILNELRSGEKSNAVFPAVHTRADGSTYPVEVHLQMYRAEDTRVFLAIVADMTEHMRAMDEIASQLDELKRWHEITLNREERIIGLKREVNALREASGLPARYKGEHIEEAAHNGR